MPERHGEELDEQRKLIEQSVHDARGKADEERRERRDLLDRTRQHERGGGQARAGLAREREAEDAELVQERWLADRATASERRSADEAIAAQAVQLGSQAQAWRELEQGLWATRADLLEIARLVAGAVGSSPGERLDQAHALALAGASQVERLREVCEELSRAAGP
ncbi:MAG: hypothetical protein AB7N76_18635 [Planctomycetota bacterium]